jgi:pimeloyl-ACP methyl ester carboxylesterase
VPKPTTRLPTEPLAVRSRRAYFDCRYGQLHVRTAFPATGGFDELVTLLCLHPDGATSRAFADLLPLAGAQRSVYAPDLPGCGESDAAPGAGDAAAAAAAVADLAADLRLRQVDVLGLQSGAAVAVELALLKPGLVRALLLAGTPPAERLALLTKQPQPPHLQPLEPALPASVLLDRMDQSLSRLGGRPVR